MNRIQRIALVFTAVILDYVVQLVLDYFNIFGFNMLSPWVEAAVRLLLFMAIYIILDFTWKKKKPAEKVR